MSSTQDTKRQHFIPQFYLRGFARESEKMYALRRDNGHIFDTTVEDACVKKRLYENRLSKEDREALDDPRFATNAIELSLSRYEAGIAPKFKQLIHACGSGQIEMSELSDSKGLLCELLVHLVERHPSSVMGNRQIASRIVKDVLSEDVDEFIKFRELAGEAIWDFATIVGEQASLEASLLHTDELAEQSWVMRELSRSSLRIIRAPVGSHFITTDMPIGAIGNKKRLEYVIFPLSSRVLALFSLLEDRADSVQKVSHSEVAEYNRIVLIASPAWATAYAPSREALVQLERNGDIPSVLS